MIKNISKLGKRFSKRKRGKKKYSKKQANLARKEIFNMLKVRQIYFTSHKTREKIIISINFNNKITACRYRDLKDIVTQVYPEFSIFSCIVIRPKKKY